MAGKDETATAMEIAIEHRRKSKRVDPNNL